MTIRQSGYDPKSAVQVLLYHLRRTPGIKCILLYHNNPETKLAAYTGKDGIIRDGLTVETHSSDLKSVHKSLISFPVDISLYSYIHHMRKSQAIEYDSSFLLAVAWVHENDQRLFELFSEVLMCDVTQGTNSEKRPLFVLLGKDRDGKFPMLFKCFMPSQQKWVFQWIFHTAIPLIFSAT